MHDFCSKIHSMKCTFAYLRNDRKIKFRMVSLQNCINEATDPSTLVKLFSLRQQEQSEHAPLSSHHYLYSAFSKQIVSRQLYSIKQRNSITKLCAVPLARRNQQLNSRLQQSQIVQRTHLVFVVLFRWPSR